MLSPDEVDAFISQQIPINTKSKTKTDIGILKRWLIGPASESREIQDIPGTELDKYLQSFYLTAKKPNGDNYEPSSLRSFAYSFDRYLSTNHYGLTITQSGEFKRSRDVLAAKLKQLKSIGKGRKPNQCEPLSFEEEEVLWEKKLLGASNPKSLLNAMWWRNNFFGLRGRDEHRKLTWGDISIQTDIDGRRYLLYHERDTKTRKDPGQHRAYPPRIYEMPEQPDRCPVQLLLEYTHRTAVGQELAKQLFCHFHDGDDLHSTENKNKMAANIPLNDEDRFPWLLSIHECIKRYKHAHQNAVVACSALKQRYRHILLHGKDDVHQQMTVTVVLGSGSQNADTSPNPEVTVPSPKHDATESLADGTMFVYLKGNTELLASRLQGRQGHFFPPSLLESQFAALEEPTESEHSILINIEKSVGEIVHDIMESCQTL